MNKQIMEQLLHETEMCADNNVRQRVCQFITNCPETQKFVGMRYYALEDAITEFVVNILNEIKGE